MEVIEDGRRLYLLGDPHTGRTFLHGVPLHRRGEREASVMADLRKHLSISSMDIHVCLGDLFDKWLVSYDLIIEVAKTYIAAATLNPETKYYILKGNHDWQRDMERHSAFDVFEMLVKHQPNIIVVSEMVWDGNLLFYPWHPLDVAADVLEGCKATALFGHFDTEFGDHNMVPTKCGVPTIYTGHIHKPGEFVRDGTRVVQVGSMQPYAHGEEINEDLYVTVKASEITEPTIYKDKCLRIIGHYDGEIDCLQITYKREDTSEDKSEVPVVEMNGFDFDALFSQAFAEAEVSPETTARMHEEFLKRRVLANA